MASASMAVMLPFHRATLLLIAASTLARGLAAGLITLAYSSHVTTVLVSVK